MKQRDLTLAIPAAMIATALVVLVLCTATPQSASQSVTNDGDVRPQVLVDVARAEMIDGSVCIDLALTSLKPDLTLQDVRIAGADTKTFAPQTLGFAQEGMAHVVAKFFKKVPRIFTAVLDFGVHGQEPILITPLFDAGEMQQK